MRKFLSLCGFLLLALSGCNSKNAEGGSAVETTWTGDIAGESVTISIQTQSASLQGDGGPLLTIGGRTQAQDLTLTLDITGGTPIVISEDNPDTEENEAVATVSIGGSGINLAMDFEEVHYRGTSGTITFTSYSEENGGKVSGTIDAGLVSTTTGTSNAAQLTGDFSVTIGGS